MSSCADPKHKAKVTSVAINKQPLSTPVTTYTGRTTIVRSGDNLYSISFEAGENYLDVARWNKIDPNKPIYVGQEIKLYPPGGKAKVVNQKVTYSGKSTATSFSLEPEPEILSTTVTAAPAPKSNTPTTAVKSKSGWTWPTTGHLTQRFSEANNFNGIDIEGTVGQPVHAARGGEVVYSGNGLPGYGRMIIVKHDERFLSAYAHNSRLVVQEGSSVSTGQKIAEMGSTDSDRVKLHFEIRVDGKPVDPTRYLPQS